MPGDQQNVRWVFDLEPASGARSGGDVASRAFTPSLDTFVREVLQNSKDAQTEGASKRGVPVEVRFRLIHLTGNNFEAFRQALGWSSLEQHLMGAIDQPQGQSIEQALEELLDNGEITLLRIDDYNTRGLTGSEFGGDKSNGESKFASLCKDKLYSAKSSNTAGGSHGMGKAVLWSFSGLSTVLFNSALESVVEGKSNPRFIGRTSLPWHRTEKKAFEGPGWLGKEQRAGKEQYFAESLWGKGASKAADDLYLNRENEKTGTSILVVGFREPAEEDPSSLMETAESIEKASSKWFWPSLIGEDPSLEVTVEIQENNEVVFSNQVNAEEHKSVKPFIEAYKKWQDDNTIDEPAYPGDVAAVPIEVNLPRRHDGQDELKADTILAVRIANADEAEGHLADTVSYFRGARMIVQYRNLQRLAISARKYHAVLICGTAKASYNSDMALERFLRAAEPPEHNTWTSTENLKKEYKQGYKKALDEMNRMVRNRLRDLVTEKTKSGAQGPDLFRKKFPIGNTGGGNSARSFVDLRDLVAYVDSAGTMHFEGQLRAHSHSPKVWEAKLDFRIAEEDKRGEHAPVRSFTTTQNGRVSVYHQNGEGALTLVVSEGTRTVDFRGEINLRHAVAEPNLSSVDVEVVGQEVNR